VRDLLDDELRIRGHGGLARDEGGHGGLNAEHRAELPPPDGLGALHTIIVIIIVVIIIITIISSTTTIKYPVPE
jgi:hypothetical protein